MSYYEGMKVTRVHGRKLGRTGRFLLRMNLRKEKKYWSSREVVVEELDRGGNDNNSLMMLKNGGFIGGIKKGGYWKWWLKEKGVKWYKDNYYKIDLKERIKV